MIAVFFVRLGSGGYIMGALYKGMFGSAILAGVMIGLISMFLDYVFGVIPPLSYQTHSAQKEELA